MQIDAITTWIEGHGETVDLIKWAAILTVTGLAGGFRFLYNLFKSPTVSLQQETSKILLEELDTFQGKGRVYRVVILVRAGLRNPTKDAYHVESFYLKFRKSGRWSGWSKEIEPTTLPNRVRFPIAGGERYQNNWFSNFQDELRDLTLNEVVSPKQHKSGYLLFITHASPEICNSLVGNVLIVRARIEVTTGESFSKNEEVEITKDKALFEKWVPGISEWMTHETTWRDSGCV